MGQFDFPTRCRYRNRVYVVLDYEGSGRFLIEREGEPAFAVHRDNLHFLRPVVKASAAVDELVEQLAVQS